MKFLFKNNSLIFNISFLLLTFFPSNQSIANNTNNTEKDDTLGTDLIKTLEDQIAIRDYQIDRKKELQNTEIIISPYQINNKNPPDWWSEKQSYNISYLLSKALEYYPGLTIRTPKKWDEIILEKELGTKTKKSLGNPNERIVYIIPNINDYLFNTLRPKRRGVGLVVIAVTKKKCITETFLSTNYQIERYGFSGEKESQNEISSNQLIKTITGGTSVNLNLGLGAFGGGKFKEPPKAKVKEIVYKTVADSAEGIYCALLNQEDCLKFYKERKFESPTKDKKRRREKVIDKSC